ncbi:MAG: helix-turn-helix domain-containing protein [Cyanobacteria bacterium HKST-UBA02]|nr:helix-turn-helix domain-containing protein [Cyanobacteria bacterium HKST-UBA02]
MHAVFDHKGFYPQLDQDFRKSRSLILIQSPFLTNRRINSLRSLLSDCVERGVRVCAFVRPIDSRFGSEIEYMDRCNSLDLGISNLNSIGVHVNLRPAIHEKLVVIDESIFWEGSLNPLSYRDSSERMNRWVETGKVHQAVAKHGLQTCSECSRLAGGGSVRSVFGVLISKRRKMLEMSQREVARRARVTQSIVSRIEQGMLDCRLSTIERLCRVLEMDCRLLPSFLIPATDRCIHESMVPQIDFSNDIKSAHDIF